MFMEWMMLATGFTGGLTVVFLFRLIHRTLSDAPSVSSYFSPKGGCTDAVVDQLGRAKKEVLVLARSFASDKLSKALLDAKMRGVRVEIIMDRQNEKDPSSDLHLFADQGLAPHLDAHYTCCQDNLMLVDGRVVITGSFDFTRQGEEENSDSVLVLRGDSALVSACRKHFQDAKAKALEYRRSSSPKPAADMKIEGPLTAGSPPAIPSLADRPTRKVA